MKKNISLGIILSVAILGLTQSNPQPVVAASPTPVPGGANQLNGVSGGLSSTLFNGKVRIRQMALRAATAVEYTPADGQRGLVFSWLVSNGTHSQRTGYFAASFSDADGVSIDGHGVSVYSTFYSLQPGAAARGTMLFVISASYTPAKILLIDQGTPSGPAFRIELNSSDVPSPAATQRP
jgi:hypothetical protein